MDKLILEILKEYNKKGFITLETARDRWEDKSSIDGLREDDILLVRRLSLFDKEDRERMINKIREELLLRKYLSKPTSFF